MSAMKKDSAPKPLLSVPPDRKKIEQAVEQDELNTEDKVRRARAKS
jgi:hypothetical protein